MNHTQNLHLPQWEESDRIMRTDFNDAFAAIDAAIKAAADASPYVKLLSVTLNASTTQWNINISDMNFNTYTAFLLYPSFLTNGNSAIYLRLNNISDTYYRDNGQTKTYFLSFDGPQDYTYEALIRKSSTHYAALCHEFGYDGYQSSSAGGITSSLLSGGITKLNFVSSNSSYPLLAGSHIALYGIKR